VSWNDIDRIHNPPWSPAVTRSPWSSPAVPRSPLQSAATSHAKMSYLTGPTVHNDGRPEVSRTGVDRILPSRPVQGSWQSPRRALRGPGPLPTLVPNGPSCQVLEARSNFSVQVDVNQWTWLTPVARSGLDWSQTSLHKRLHSHVLSLTWRSEKNLIWYLWIYFCCLNLSEALSSLRLSWDWTV